jgi:hypothetical protein
VLFATPVPLMLFLEFLLAPALLDVEILSDFLLGEVEVLAAKFLL